MIAGDMVVFAVFFATFMVYRRTEPTLYASSAATLSQPIALINTLLMLSSSWFVARAVGVVRSRTGGSAVPMLFGAIACGLGFVAMKAVEYSEKIDAGVGLTTNMFYTFYFMLTGIHLLHVLIGIAVLIYLSLRLRRPGWSGADVVAAETGASFWHLVDLLWIFLFTLLYLVA
ncbi:cytochrome C oxidase, subunit III family protein [Sphingobium sp. MI1205]|nr:cytochrome C oxidase, subunit III family protein [Sphingobium sp. MI1205]